MKVPFRLPASSARGSRSASKPQVETMKRNKSQELSHPLDKNQNPSFAHPTEETFARILDYYGVEWQYEPRTFPLEWDGEGNVTEAFSPDFYLPQQDLYIELTTLRPQLTTRKNRKLKRMHELYPAINVKLFKRRDIRNLMVKYGLDQQAEKIAGSEAQSDK